MTKIEQIQADIEKLAPAEIAKLRDWLADLDARMFDDKIARDAESGKLDKLISDAKADHKAGRTEEF